MARLVKFIILALVAFAMGAALAIFQQRQNTPSAEEEKAAIEKQIAEIKPVPVGERSAPQQSLIEGAPAMPGSETSMPETEAAAPENTPDQTEASDAAVAPEQAEAGATDDAQAGAADVAAEAPAETASEVAADVAPSDEETAPAVTQGVAGSSVGGSFTMVDQNGVEVTEKSWPGKLKLVFFGFTHCPDVCPTALTKIGAALEALGDKAGHIQPIFVTTDPKRDTSARLKEYLADYDSRVVGLTGSDAQVDHIKGIYKVYAAIAEGGDADNYLMDHSGYIYLMSADDQLLEIFGSSDTAETIVQKSAPHLSKPE